jgi:hypothetical protein
MEIRVNPGLLLWTSGTRMSAPVCKPVGDMVFALNIYRMPRELTGTEIRRCGRHLTRRAFAIRTALSA